MRSALVLNASYEPLSVVSARRAACLVLADKADIIEEDGTELHSPSLVLPSPLVVRLRYMVKVPFHRRTALSRRAVFARDDYRCQYCGAPGRLDRPRDAPLAWRRARVGERRRGVPAVQPRQARPHARRGRDAPGPPVPGAAGHGVGGRQRGPRARGVEAVPRHRILIAVTVDVVRRPARSRGSAGRVPRAGRRRRPGAGGVGVRASTGRRSCSARRQRADVVDAAACAGAGVEVVRRRSGGGAVLLEPGASCGSTSSCRPPSLRGVGVGDDVGASMVWLGEHVAARARRRSASTASTVHRGGDGLLELVPAGVLRRPRSGRGRCGDGVKLVGISQRRTRAGARFQCAVHERWSPDRLVALLAGDAARPATLPPVATLAGGRRARALPAAVAAALGPLTAARRPRDLRPAERAPDAPRTRVAANTRIGVSGGARGREVG